MDAASWKQLLKRINDNEKRAVRYRQGVVTDDSPLSVVVGGSDVPYTDVAAMDVSVSVGDPVAVLTFGHDLLVLGKIGADLGAGGGTGPAGPTGATGATGATGPRGIAGTAMWSPPTGAIAENVPRLLIGSASIGINVGVLTLIGGLTLEAGRTYSSATFLSGSVAHTGMTHNWACFVRVSDRQIMAVSADNGTDWAASTLRTFTFGTPYVPSVDEAVWVGLVIVSVSFGALTGNAGSVGTGLTPYWNGESNSGLTTPLSVTTIVNAPTDSGRGPYWTYVS